MNLAQHIGEQARRVNVSPTEAQKLAGNYRKGHVKVHGLDITIENPKGSTRSGISPSGKKWQSILPEHYGYIRRTEGGDGDHVDVFVGPHLRSSRVFVIDQHDPDRGYWDEHKCMLGFSSRAQAKAAYARAFSDRKGYQRIGHIEALSIDEFKDWLRDGDTKVAIRHRAAGGGVQEGPPPFEATTDVPSFDQTEPAAEDPGIGSALARGAMQGATFNLSDEISGAQAAAPKWGPVGPISRTVMGAGRLGLNAITGMDPEAQEKYEAARDAERKAIKAAKESHPYYYAGAEMAGAIPAMAALPEAGVGKALLPAATGIAKFGRGAIDAAITAGEYGGLTGVGEGESMADRAIKGATGMVSGLIAGPVGHAVGWGTGKLGEKFIGPAVQTMRGWVNPEGEAARRVASALKADNELIMAGKAKGLTPQQWAAARQNGEPVTLADLGAGHTQDLLRSAANTSPEARALLEKVIDDRFLNQHQRVASTVRSAIPGASGNARKTADQLVAAYDAGRVPAYKKAYADGDKQIFTPAIDRLTGSTIFGNAMKSAISSGKDRAVTEGFGSFTPAVSVGPSGNFIFGKAGSGPVYPNLQYWDQVKRELDAVANMAKRSGDNERADVAGKMAKVLRTELDREVPSYATARGIAEDFFGEKNALEAGRKLAGKRADPEEVKAALRKMKPDERTLFQEGYAADLAERVILDMKDTANITKGRGILQSPNERKLASAIFGPGGMAMLQARMHLETIMDGARQAMGNSTTARQLIQAGLAGGALSGYASGWDPGSMMAGATGMAGARWGKGAHAGLNQMAVGAKHLIGKVDAKTAARVAQLLTSDDPRLLRQGYQMAAKSQAIMDGLRRTAEMIGMAGGTGARRPAGEGIRMLQGPVGARADEEQQRP